MSFSLPAPNRASAGLLGRRLPIVALAMIATGCGDSGATTSGSADRPVVVVTTSIWADVVANVACDGTADIDTVIPVGADAHAFEPSLADRARFEEASLVVANGLRLEQGLDDTIEAAEEGGAPVLRLGDHLDTIAYRGSGDHSHGGGEDDHDEDDSHDEDDHDHGGAAGDDPHIWFDPVRVAGVLPVVADRLVADAGLDRATVDACVAGYRAELEELDADIAGRVAELPPERRVLVANHDTLGYYADRYGFEVIGTVSPSPAGLAEANPADLEALAEGMERAGSRAIFVDASASTDDAEALARRLGDVEVVTLFTESLSEPGGGAETYLDLLATDSDRILDALG